MRRRKAGTCIVIHIRVNSILALNWRVPVVRPLLAACGACPSKGDGMVQIGVVCAGLLFAACGPATAESPAERGLYLVNTVMACGNCHTPRDARGTADGRQGALGRFDVHDAGFRRHRAEHHGRCRNRKIGGWSDAEIKRTLVEGVRPDPGRLAAACRWRRSCPPTSTRRCCRTISTPSSPILRTVKLGPQPGSARAGLQGGVQCHPRSVSGCGGRLPSRRR